MRPYKKSAFLLILCLTLACRIKCQETNDIKAQESSGCIQKIINNDSSRTVCVCDGKYCDNDLDIEWPESTDKLVLIASTRGGQRFQRTYREEVGTNEKLDEADVYININTSDTKQPILGWGGAFTDAATLLIESSNSIDGLRNNLLGAYFGSGLKYNMGRVPIGGSDFSTRPYTYDDTVDDKPDIGLKNWSLAEEDLQYKIPVLRRANQLSSGLKLLASPWSPPRWMKANNNLIRGYLKDSAIIYDAYAKYLVKFFDAYREAGVEFWGATVQNEPISAYMPTYFFNSLQFTASDMTKFIGKYYGPTLEASNRTRENFKLFVGDDNLGFVNILVPDIMKDKQAAKYISGLAYHFYLSGRIVSYDYLNRLYDGIKSQIDYVIMTEGCMGSSVPYLGGPSLGDWIRAEAYALDIIEDLSRHTNAWIDWNLVLDLEGGPNWSSNFVDSPIILDKKKQSFYKQPMYYALAHFSTLFRPGCRVIIPISVDGQTRGAIKSIACVNEQTGHLVVNLLNQDTNLMRVNMSVNNKPKASLIEIPPKSLVSVVIKLAS